MPVWLENDAPSTSSRSASFITQLATGVPLRPSTPAASGWSSPIWPLALNVVITGAPSCSASAVTALMWKRAPWPTMITGRFEPRSSRRASAIDSSGGEIVDGDTRPVGPPASAPSGAGSVCTSSGKIRCATSRRSSAFLHARFISSTGLESCSTGWLQAATEPNAPDRSTSWNAPGPSTCVSTWPVSARTGARSTFASHSPVRRLVAPGPAIVRQAAGRPVSLP